MLAPLHGSQRFPLTTLEALLVSKFKANWYYNSDLEKAYDIAGHGLDKAGQPPRLASQDTALLWHSHLSRLQPRRERSTIVDNR